ncbi:hypothetical protein N7536_009475 [Penicillium majusculum]|uniref:Uncharacterized protein n=1 Tax=Penicillium solitum TaxID=60172 RepID=A0A1V6R968_9EURO|nr:uncharacterized protein PENSOL_c010G11511 [Penicillium solitum]KAJ5686856.1 hypothetical protein N7536_009475 [Penicillium majusculum]OQD98085.1 hypothetical protein PENSOL_c010G11511 [Penicillium solitum]
MASNQPTLLEYARFYNIAEDSTGYCPINYADNTCEPATPILPVEGLDPEHPEERLKEIDRRFCTEIMMEKLPIKPEDMDMLAGCLQLDDFNRNLWRGILPQVTTSDVKGEPFLFTAVNERMVTSSEFNTTFVQSPSPFSPIPSVRLVVPSGPDVPVVPMNTRDVFDHYNSELSQSNSVEGFTAPQPVTAEFSNIPTTSYLAGDAVPPIVGPSGTVHQFISVESDPVPSIEDQENESYASSVLSSEHPTESEFSAVDFDNTASAPSFEVSPYKKAQPTLTTVSPNLTKEKGFSIGRVDNQKAQAPRALKERKEMKTSLESVADTRIPCEPKGIAAGSFSALHEDTLVPKGACASSSITQPAKDQNITQLARDSQNANDGYVFFHTLYQQNLNAMATHTSPSVNKRASCIPLKELFHMKLGYKLHSTGLRKSAFKSPHAVSSVDYGKTSKSSKPVFGGLGSLSLFMQTRGSDGGYVTSSHDPSSLSLSTSTRSGQDESSSIPSFVGDGPPDPGKTPSEPSRSPSPAFEMQEMVTRSAFDPPPMFFLSTALLTTHPSVVRDMERWPQNPPKLIYRDYGDVYSDSRYHYDAEIILAPDSGIILTTPHELTQRYLPGHGPRDARLDGIEGLNSPFREKIFCLMHRYVVLVVLICKPETADLGRVSNTSLTREITSLARFCDLYGEWSTTLLIPIPNHSASIVLWCFGMGRLRYELFPPGSIENVTEEESDYEVVLRDVGINPFGARFILDNIRVGGFKENPGSDPDPSPVPAEERVSTTSSDSRAFDVFINMEPLEQVMQYGSSLGNKQMHRVSEVIELMAHSRSDDNETNSEDIYGTQISLD